MNKIGKISLLLFCNLITAIIMGTFAYKTYNESKIVQSVIFAAACISTFIVVILSLVPNRNDNKRRSKL
ncbi:hypothetical protein GHH_c01960 [Geobacillus sp. GHH01]|jgi:hypothetical protein|uniref:Hypothetical conserved protein n=1 Tax=Geobacillus kaustophilus (strain HTA426) TaxID=235909 RepID=Q5L3M7_GEOKA|nr:hypothetical protein [Geobacillus kaustophilus]AGE20779.1 hypothetical protein GHH_c01960 [Geobacillus sp. GHH01]MED4301694.1 hypothetical protein [Geobacillus stearothermophilus]NNV00959.1 hypothetical protein [Geobacillus sp. DSP4a]OQP09374.1 hypothetical protein B1692_17005 [Geobacillus thermoleovorans]STO35736.1 Uncharacterised protein [[Flavobacterium] thermophilum]